MAQKKSCAGCFISSLILLALLGVLAYVITKAVAPTEPTNLGTMGVQNHEMNVAKFSFQQNNRAVHNSTNPVHSTVSETSFTVLGTCLVVTLIIVIIALAIMLFKKKLTPQVPGNQMAYPPQVLPQQISTPASVLATAAPMLATPAVSTQQVLTPQQLQAVQQVLFKTLHPA